MSDHTPGEWEAVLEADAEEYYARFWRIFTDLDGGIALVWTNDEGDDPRSAADAALITAAPDLLAAAKGVVDSWRRDGEPGLASRIVALIACIDKAEGRK